MGFYIVPKRKMISPEKETPAITIIEQIQEGDTYYTDWWADFPFRIRIPVGTDMFDSGAVNQQALTLIPNKHTETTSVDGEVKRIELGGITWDALQGEDGNFYDDDNDSARAAISSTTDNKWKSLFRIVLVYDGSPLQNKGTVKNATLSVFGSSKIDSLGISPTLNVYTSAPASNTALANGDYDSLGTTPLCDTAITYANFKAETTGGSYLDNGWNHFALNATGIAHITTALASDGIIKLGLREATYDATDTEPAWADSDDASFFIVTADESTTPNPPRLTVTYKEYGGGVWIEGEKLHIISQTNTEQIALNESTFDANTILKADSNDTPEALTVAEQRLVGRVTSGEVDALTGAQSMTVLSGQAGADFSMNSHKITSVTDPASNQDAATKKYVDDTVGASGSYFHDGDVDGGVISGILGALDHLDINLDGGTL